jgi:hypothetical protein
MITQAQLTELYKQIPRRPAARAEHSKLLKLFKEQELLATETSRQFGILRSTPTQSGDSKSIFDIQFTRHGKHMLQFNQYIRRFGILPGQNSQRRINLLTTPQAMRGISTFMKVSKLSNSEIDEIEDYLGQLNLNTYHLRGSAILSQAIAQARLQNSSTNTPPDASHQGQPPDEAPPPEETPGDDTTPAPEESHTSETEDEQAIPDQEEEHEATPAAPTTHTDDPPEATHQESVPNTTPPNHPPTPEPPRTQDDPDDEAEPHATVEESTSESSSSSEYETLEEAHERQRKSRFYWNRPEDDGRPLSPTPYDGEDLTVPFDGATTLDKDLFEDWFQTALEEEDPSPVSLSDIKEPRFHPTQDQLDSFNRRIRKRYDQTQTPLNDTWLTNDSPDRDERRYRDKYVLSDQTDEWLQQNLALFNQAIPCYVDGRGIHIHDAHDNTKWKRRTYRVQLSRRYRDRANRITDEQFKRATQSTS